MNKEQREVVADWLIVFGSVGLLLALFMTWSHQLSGPLLALSGSSDALRGVPRDPTAWQVYSTADVALALVAVGLFVVALIGSRPARLGAVAGAAVALAFVIHAAGAPPSNGVESVLGQLQVPTDLRTAATPGPGITVAMVALLLALSGLALSFTAD
jgi:hypothetical protein